MMEIIMDGEELLLLLVFPKLISLCSCILHGKIAQGLVSEPLCCKECWVMFLFFSRNVCNLSGKFVYKLLSLKYFKSSLLTWTHSVLTAIQHCHFPLMNTLDYQDYHVTWCGFKNDKPVDKFAACLVEAGNHHILKTYQFYFIC